MSPVYAEVRDAFFEELYAVARSDRDVLVLSADQGAMSLEKFARDIPRQYLQMGIAEQNMVGVAAGLALTGKKVFVYAIIPFLTLRCLEHIRVDVCSMGLPVNFIGIGAGYAYNTDGPTHHAVNDVACMRALPGMQIWNPSDHTMIAWLAGTMAQTPGPKYIRLDKGAFPPLYSDDTDFGKGVAAVRPGRDVTIVATGVMVHRAVRIAEELEKYSVEAAVVDCYRLKPVNEDALLEAVGTDSRVVTLEENSIVGGLGSLVCEVLADRGRSLPVKRLALADQFRFELGSREKLQAIDGLDADQVCKAILEFRG